MKYAVNICKSQKRTIICVRNLLKNLLKFQLIFLIRLIVFNDLWVPFITIKQQTTNFEASSVYNIHKAYKICFVFINKLNTTLYSWTPTLNFKACYVRLCDVMILRSCDVKILSLWDVTTLKLCDVMILRLWDATTLKLCDVMILRLWDDTTLKLCDVTILRLWDVTTLKLCSVTILRLWDVTTLQLCDVIILR